MAAVAIDSDDEEICGGFEYAVPLVEWWRSAKGDAVQSPTVLVGKFPAGLRVCPKGIDHSAEGFLDGAFMVRARKDWVSGWEFRDVSFVVELKNNRRKPHRAAAIGGMTFNRQHLCHRFKVKVGESLNVLTERGWVSDDDTLVFHVTVRGKSLGLSWDNLSEDGDRYVRLWKSMAFTDMDAVAGEGGERLPCHRAVLAACSPVFERMLSSGMQEGAGQRLVLQHVSRSTALALLEYLYTRNRSSVVLLDFRILRDLLPLADQYELPELVEQCASNLVEIMGAGNAHGVLSLLRTYRSNKHVREHFLKAQKAVQENSVLLDSLLVPASPEGAAAEAPAKRPRLQAEGGVES